MLLRSLVRPVGSSWPPTTPGSPTRPTGPAGTPSPPSVPPTAGGSHPRRRLRARGGRRLDAGLRRAGGQARALRLREYRDAAARLALPHDRVPQLRRGLRAAGPAHRLPHRPRARPRADPRLLRLAGRPDVLLDAVHPPPLGAALHARAGRRPRARRARQHARQPGLRRALRAGRPGLAAGPRPTRRSSSSAGSSGSRSSSAWRGRTASCAPTAPACSRRSASSTPSATPRSARST